MRKLTFLALAAAGLGYALKAQVRKPKGIEPVTGFDSQRYLGKWYEIARLDYRFERGLDHVTAEYAAREDGGIQVTNRGYDTANGKWEESVGKAYFVEKPETAYLKVSFFGPLYASYLVIDLDPDYRWALVTGKSRDYLWILSRTPELDEATKKRLTVKAQALGYVTGKLVWVKHDSGQHPQGEVDRLDVLGQAADGDAVHPRLGDGAHGVQIDPA